jgi:hypothetical protein
MRMDARISRRTDADALAERLLDAAKAKAVKAGCAESEVVHFCLGYLRSQVASMAADSPSALKSLRSNVVYAESTTK